MRVRLHQLCHTDIILYYCTDGWGERGDMATNKLKHQQIPVPASSSLSVEEKDRMNTDMRGGLKEDFITKTPEQDLD